MTMTRQPQPAQDRTLIVPRGEKAESLQIPKCMLLAVAGPLQGREFIIEKDVYAIGSGRHNDLSIQDSTVSRHHCEIRMGPDGHVVRDLGSTNGTLVQGVRVMEAYLPQSAEIQIGNTRLVFCPLRDSVDYMLSRSESFGKLLGHSVAMRHVFHLAETYGPTDATILIEGETGTGKEVLAEEIHRHSPRRDRPFVVIDCATLARELIESELFGHTRGSFTGATQDRTGAFEHANGGTVFLDEISELSPDLQPKLLRVLEKRHIRRLGSNDLRPINVRILSATNRQLRQEVSQNRFREDLFYRLSVVHIEMPPLRRRKDDVPLLAETFLKDLLGSEGPAAASEFARTVAAFRNYDWPGNVRELRNLVEIAAYSSLNRKPAHLAACLYLEQRQGAAVPPEEPTPEFALDQPFKDAKNELIRRFEAQYVDALLRRCEGNVSRAAREAGIERAYLQRLLRKHKPA